MGESETRSIANLSRLNRLMDESGLDAIVLRSGQNFTYLSGVVFPGTLARLQDLTDSARGVLLVWPRRGEPVIIANKTSAGLVRRDGWVDRVELCEGYVQSPYDRLVELIGDLGLSSATIGFEKDTINIRDWETIARGLASVRMVDCAEMMNRVRWIKTPAEVERIRTAAGRLDDVYREVFGRIRVGMTERDIHADMIGTSLRAGFGWAHGILNTHRNTIPYAGESAMTVERGDVIRTDYVCYLAGYPGHQSRNVIVGEPTSQQRDEYRINLEIYRATIDRCRVGARVGDLFDFVMAEFKRVGWSYNSLLIGHGVGAWWHQQEPILRRNSEIVLEAGMVLALEPHKDHWHVQDMILVREGAPELLSDSFNTDEAFVVSV